MGFVVNTLTNGVYQGSVYGGPVIQAPFKAVNHHGYVYAKLSGTYTFSVPASDDITLVWLGDNAYTAYTRENAGLVQDYVQFGGVTQTYTIDLVAGTYTPLRILAVNGQEVFSFALTIQAPDGSLILSDSTFSGSPYLVQFSCDNTALPFPPFGQEIVTVS